MTSSIFFFAIEAIFLVFFCFINLMFLSLWYNQLRDGIFVKSFIACFVRE